MRSISACLIHARMLCLLGLAGCVEMEPSGKPFSPVIARAAEAKTKQAGAPQGQAAPREGFDFEADDRSSDAQTPPSADLNDLQARMLGLSPEEARRFANRARADEQTPADPGVHAQPAPIWDPTVPLPQISFGVRVLAVVLDVQPPRAMLALPDGREIVVQPGTMLPNDGLVVLAIGRDAVQVAKVTPSGYYATVQTETVQAMYGLRESIPQPAP